MHENRPRDLGGSPCVVLRKKEYYCGRSSERFFVMMMSKLVRIGGEVILRLLNASMVKDFVDYVTMYINN